MNGIVGISVWSDLDVAQRRALLCRPAQDLESIVDPVAEIINSVVEEGDAAIRRLTELYDGVFIRDFAVPSSIMNQAADQVSARLLEAMRSAISRIRRFHASDKPADCRVETAPGLVCESRYLPLEPVGLYVPGGTAPLFSTVMMLAIPAKLAGCRDIILCTPPQANGEIAPETLVAASLCGVRRVFRAGGAQAIAAMAYGTESIPRCRKIFGPGNRWVTEAKRQVSQDPSGAAFDLPAGPSEVMVIADETAAPDAIAWDLLSQAEHGPDSQVILVSKDRELAESAWQQVLILAADLPRADILRQALLAARILLVENDSQAIDIAEAYAPEHLIINTRKPRELAQSITSAGSVFLGRWTPESLGDYCSGPNHVLPTYGYARAFGALGVSDFMRRMTIQEASRDGLAAVGPDAQAMASAEGLDAHRLAIQWRLEQPEAER